jgi:glyoxylase-like metal-dependent hydrolase (beta-lactamase superfamily II)
MTDSSQQHPSLLHRPPQEFVVRPDVTGLRTLIVNVGFIGNRGTRNWVLVDTGVHLSKNDIVTFVEKNYTGPPLAILLTHGHFDHVGSILDLLNKWDVPVFAHEDELPFLTGKADYPPADPTVGGGLMAWVSPTYPHKGIDLGDQVQALPSDGSLPNFKDWKWLLTPGHSPGHVSFFREKDHTLIAGDAFITVKQESALDVITQKKTIHGPPTYFTPDWEQARESVKKLEALNPDYALTGHGQPMEGKELKDGLKTLVSHFDEMAIPDHGRYVND